MVTLDDPDPDPTGGCETAYAKAPTNSFCFIDEGFNRWGWRNEVSSGPTVQYPIYAGAGQCDISKGEQSAVANITYDGTNLTVEVNALTGFVIQQAHLYIGEDNYPTGPGNNGSPTVAPGQYTFVEEGLNNVSYTFGPILVDDYDIEGDFNLILHLVTCKDESTSKQITTAIPYPTIFENEVMVKVETNENTKADISIYTLGGNLVKEFKNLDFERGTNTMRMELESLESSMYLMVITTASGEKITKKIISK